MSSSNKRFSSGRSGGGMPSLSQQAAAMQSKFNNNNNNNNNNNRTMEVSGGPDDEGSSSNSVNVSGTSVNDDVMLQARGTTTTTTTTTAMSEKQRKRMERALARQKRDQKSVPRLFSYEGGESERFFEIQKSVKNLVPDNAVVENDGGCSNVVGAGAGFGVGAGAGGNKKDDGGYSRHDDENRTTDITKNKSLSLRRISEQEGMEESTASDNEAMIVDANDYAMGAITNNNTNTTSIAKNDDSINNNNNRNRNSNNNNNNNAIMSEKERFLLLLSQKLNDSSKDNNYNSSNNNNNNDETCIEKTSSSSNNNNNNNNTSISNNDATSSTNTNINYTANNTAISNTSNNNNDTTKSTTTNSIDIASTTTTTTSTTTIIPLKSPPLAAQTLPPPNTTAMSEKQRKRMERALARQKRDQKSVPRLFLEGGESERFFDIQKSVKNMNVGAAAAAVDSDNRGGNGGGSGVKRDNFDDSDSSHFFGGLDMDESSSIGNLDCDISYNDGPVKRKGNDKGEDVKSPESISVQSLDEGDFSSPIPIYGTPIIGGRSRKKNIPQSVEEKKGNNTDAAAAAYLSKFHTAAIIGHGRKDIDKNIITTSKKTSSAEDDWHTNSIQLGSDQLNTRKINSCIEAKYNESEASLGLSALQMNYEEEEVEVEVEEEETVTDSRHSSMPTLTTASLSRHGTYGGPQHQQLSSLHYQNQHLSSYQQQHNQQNSYDHPSPNHRRRSLVEEPHMVHPMNRMGSSESNLHNFLYNRDNPNGGSDARTTNNSSTTRYQRQRRHSGNGGGNRRRKGVKRMDDGVLADSFSHQKSKYAAASAARSMNAPSGNASGLRASGGLRASIIGMGGFSNIGSILGVAENTTTGTPALDGVVEDDTTAAAAAAVTTATAQLGGSPTNSSNTTTTAPLTSRRSSNESIGCVSRRDSNESAGVQSNAVTEKGLRSSLVSQQSILSSSTMDSWQQNGTINGTDDNDEDEDFTNIPKTQNEASFLARLFAMNPTYLIPTQRRFRRKKSSTISMLDNQFFVPPPEDGTTLLQSLMFWFHGHGVDFVVWIYQSSFLTVLLFCLVSYYVLVFAFAGMLLWMEHQTDGRCSWMDADKRWGNAQEFEMAFELSWSTFTTVGYGQVSPSGSEDGCYPIRVVCALFAFLGLLFNSLSAAIFFSKLERILTRASVTFCSSVSLQFGKSVSNRGGNQNYGQMMRTTSVVSLSAISECSGDQSSKNAGLESLEVKDNQCIPEKTRRKCPYPYMEFRIVNDHANNKNRAIWNAEVSAMIQLSAKDVEKTNKHKYNTSSGELFREYVTPSSQSKETIKTDDTDATTRTRASNARTRRADASHLTASIVSTAMVVQESDTGTGKGAHPEGRIYYPLSLEPSAHPYFRRVFYVRHTLNSRSPLVKSSVRQKIKENGGWDPNLCRYQDILDSVIEFHRLRITFKGISAVSNKVVYAQKVYTMEDVFVGWQFGQIFYEKKHRFRKWWKSQTEEDDEDERDDDANLMLDKRLIHDIIPQRGGEHEPIEG